MNLVILTGNLGAEIDVRTSGETTFAHFSVATNFRVKKGDDYEDRVTWTRVTAFNGLAKSLRVLDKGSKVLVRGHLKTSVFERDGVRFQHSEVIADEVEFLRVKRAGDGAEEGAGDGAEAQGPTSGDEDVPL
jgi:single-strand DNA-binding protein